MKKTAFIKSGIVLKAILCLAIALLLSCKANSSSLPKKDLVITKHDGTTVTVNAEIADKEDTRMRGFMEREVIPEGTGMLFVFEKDQRLSFWMKNTPHPLSIAYIDSRGTIRNIYDMTPFSLASVVSTVSCRYALEVPQGWFDKAGIQPGDTIDLTPVKH